MELGVRRSIIPWICSFLTERTQCVKLAQSTSQWLPVNAGVPQGTIVLFVIMINDLKLASLRCSYWKYIDDVTISELVPARTTSTLQSELDALNSWADKNNMKLSPKICKELTVHVRRHIEHFPPALAVNGNALETDRPSLMKCKTERFKKSFFPHMCLKAHGL